MTSDAQEIARIWSRVKRGYASSSHAAAWARSPFADLRIEVSGRKGAVAKRIVEELCKSQGLAVSGGKKSAFDRLINGHPFQIRFSFLWDSGRYKFQQIKDQKYDHLFLLGVSPNDAHAWIVSKQMALQRAKGQHTGSKGRDTKWIECDPSSPPAWLVSRGGTLEDALGILRDL